MFESLISHIVGNKSDKVTQREIPRQVGEEFASRNSMVFLETSAKESDNVEKLFMDIATELTKQARANDLRPGFADSQEIGVTSPVHNWTQNCCKLQ